MTGELNKLHTLMQATKQNILEMNNMISEWSKTSNIKDELTGQIVNDLSHKIADLTGAWYDMDALVKNIEDAPDAESSVPLTELEKEPATTEDKHFGEEQAEGLDSLLAGLKDTPHDDRW